jgi:molybdopterin-guanine dinucleotide biosynthesis protein A
VIRPDAFVLAGGASRRMGRDKALVEDEAGRRFVDRVVVALALVASRVRVVRRSPTPLPPHEVIVDLDGPLHPLTGLATALRAASTPLVLVAPCDLPGLRPEHVRALVAGAAGDVAIASDGARDQPLLGLWRADEAEAVLAAAVAGRSVRGVVGDRRRVTLPESALRNANFPADLSP